MLAAGYHAILLRTCADSVAVCYDVMSRVIIVSYLSAVTYNRTLLSAINSPPSKLIHPALNAV